MPIHSTMLLWLVAAPLIGGAVTLLMPRTQQRHPWWGVRIVAIAFCLIAVGFASYLTRQMTQGGPGLVAGYAATLALRLDVLSTPLLILITGIGLLAACASSDVRPNLKSYYTLVQLATASALLVVTAGTTLSFSLALAVFVLLVYLLIHGWGIHTHAAAARRFLFMALAGSLCIAVALFTGGALHHELSDLPAYPTGQTGGFWLLLLGLGVLIGLFPLHGWLADVLEFAPTTVGMLTVAVVQTVGGYGMLRLLSPRYADQIAAARPILAAFATVTIAYGALAALRQTHLKRIAAFLSISLMGLFFLGLVTATPGARTGAVYLLLGHAVAVALLVYAAGILETRLGHANISQLDGLSTYLPGFAAGTGIALVAAVALPGLCLFPGMFLILLSTFQASHYAAQGGRPMAWMAAIACASWGVLLITGVWTFVRIFTGPPRPEHATLPPLGFAERWILTLLSTAAVLMGILPTLWLPGDLMGG